MRWRPVAATAAGVVAVIGFGAGKAAAEPADEPADAPATTTTTAKPIPTGREDDLARAGALMGIANEMQTSADEPAPEKPPLAADGEPISAPASPAFAAARARSATPPDATPATPSPAGPASGSPRTDVHLSRLPGTDAQKVGTSARPGTSHRPGPVAAAAAGEAPPAPDQDPAPQGAPADDSAPGSPAPAQPVPATSANVKVTSAKATDAATSPDTASVAGSEQWWPTWAGNEVDQRLAAAWRETPVRGPPPGTASALGNDGRTTIYQVAIVDGPDGFEVSISSSQSAEVTNAGYAVADARGPGSASATGDTATTAIYQTSVVVQRGTGTATVEQDAKVDNLGYAVAATSGAGDAEAVGNASSTTVHQTAVVVILGSGDAQVSQSTEVLNAGGATAISADRTSRAAGNSSTTNVNQVAVVVVRNDDTTVRQTSTTQNIGVATATGGTAQGNIATNSVEQVAVNKQR